MFYISVVFIFSQCGYATSLCYEVTGSTVRDCSIMVAFTQILHWKIFKRKATINNHVYIMNYRNVARFIVICTSLLHCSSPSPMLRGAYLHPCFSQCKHGQWLYAGAQHSQYINILQFCAHMLRRSLSQYAVLTQLPLSNHYALSIQA